jgi:hemerythrin superfamily protein
MKTAKTKKRGGAKMPAKALSRRKQAMTAIDLLKEDHKMVQDIFKEYRKLIKDGGDDRRKEMLVRRACDALTVHAQIEEEIFYPSLREEIDDQEMMDEAQVEHDSAKDLIAQLQRMQPGDEFYDAKFIVLGEQVKHHISEEEGKIFPKAKKCGLNLQDIGRELAEYKQELEQGMRRPQGRDSRRQREPERYDWQDREAYGSRY